MTLRAQLPALAAGLALIAIAGAAHAQCCAPPPPPCCQPPPPPPPPRDAPCCSGGGHTVKVPGVNVVVSGPVVAVAGARATAGASAGAGAGGNVYVGGGGSWHQGQTPPSVVSGFRVDAGVETEVRKVAYEARREVFRRVVIRAACIDDRGAPHVAAQVRPDRDVLEGYEGELWRCVAGTRLQYTIVEDGRDTGETLLCAKGEALHHGPGGAVVCRPQAPARECNERSLLRRYGAGEKVLVMRRTETYTAYREETVTVARASASGSTIVFDGGVGQVVY